MKASLIVSDVIPVKVMHTIRLQPAALDRMPTITHVYPYFLNFKFFISFITVFITHPTYLKLSCLIIVVKNFP